jgi:hypothetical protein
MRKLNVAVDQWRDCLVARGVSIPLTHEAFRGLDAEWPTFQHSCGMNVQLSPGDRVHVTGSNVGYVFFVLVEVLGSDGWEHHAML